MGKCGIPDFVKMDIEGGEVKALEGATNLLERYHPIWLIELHGEACAYGVGEIMKKHGYRLFNLANERLLDESPLPHHILAKI